jgi:flagellar biosynthesis protein FlhF
LSQSLEASGASPVLVLDAGIGSADSAEVAQTFAALGSRWLLVTKLDVAQRLGGVLAAAEAGLALAEAGIGPTIGRGLGPLSAAGLARLLCRSEPGTDPSQGGIAAHDLGSKAS